MNNQAADTIKGKEGKYLTFSLGQEDYGIEILKVREIIGMMPVTTMPQTPDYIKGVINLRGRVIPVLDLRTRFGMEWIEHRERSCIIVIESTASDMNQCWNKKKCEKRECPAYGSSERRCWMISGTYCRDEIQGSFHEKIDACKKCDVYKTAQERLSIFILGIIVDSVSEVLSIRQDDIEDVPNLGAQVDAQFISGIAKQEGGIKILLNVDRVLNTDEFTLLKKAA